MRIVRQVQPAARLVAVEAEDDPVVTGRSQVAQGLHGDQEAEEAADVRLHGLAGAAGSEREEAGVEEVAQLVEQRIELVVADRGVELADDVAQAAAECSRRTGEGDDVTGALAIGEDAQCVELEVAVGGAASRRCGPGSPSPRER